MLDYQNRDFKKQKLCCLNGIHLKYRDWDFPGSPVVETSPFKVGGMGSVLGSGAKITNDSQPRNENIK